MHIWKSTSVFQVLVFNDGYVFSQNWVLFYPNFKKKSNNNCFIEIRWPDLDYFK
jgi:hypothetical protein